jgi:glycosyltransferase involved in cell wall biosynthesis
VSVAIFLTSFDPGGTERQMIELVRRLDRTRWQVHVACFHARGAWLERAAERAASLVEFSIPSFLDTAAWRQARQFASWCRHHDIRVLQTADLYANIFALPAAAAADVPVRIASRRDINPGRTMAQIAVQRAAYACSHRIVANSRAAAVRVQREGISSSKVAVIANGIDLDRFPTPATGSGGRRVLTVANLRPEKGHDVVIEAAAIVLRQFPDVTFEFVGGGSERPRLAALADARGVQHAILFEGHCEDVGRRMAAADVFVLASRTEAFPNAVLEAMAAGLPVVATRVGGIPEIVDDGRTGLLVPAGDPASLADRLMRTLADAPLRARLGAAARQHITDNFSFERMTAAFESLYLDELERRHFGEPPAVTRLAS